MSDPHPLAVLLREAVPEPPARPALFDEVVLRAVRERRTRRLQAGTVAASVVAVLGAGLLVAGPGRGDGDVVAVPASTSAGSASTSPPSPPVAGTPTPAPPVPGPSRSRADVPGSSAAANRRIAADLAERLLAGVVLPPDAVGVTDDAVPQKASSYPDSTAERRHRVVNVGLSPEETLRRIAAAFPADLGGPWTPKNPVPAAGLTVLSDWTWQESYRPAIWGATVWLTVVPASGGTLVRVDAEAVWLDPVPRPDRATDRLRFTTASGCPRDAVGDRSVRNVPGAVPDGVLLPAQAPTTAVVCGWSGSKPPTRTVLGAAGARRLATAFRAMPLGHPAAPARFYCPSEAGQRTFLVAFRYPGRPDVALAVTPGCAGTTRNGAISVDGAPDDFDTSRFAADPPR